MSRAAWWCALLLLLAGCGDTREIRERDLVVGGGAPPAPARPSARAPEPRSGALRIAVVTHGQAANPFWVVVRNGIDAAARQVDVSVTYQAPDTYSIARMRALIDAAVADRPDGLVVSLPSREVIGPVRRAVRAGIPVVSINSGSRVSRGVGVLAHVGQSERRAGTQAGRRLVRAGVRRALCVNQQAGNVGLDLRCRAAIAAVRRAGGQASLLPVDVQDRTGTRQELTEAIQVRRVDGVLTLDTGGAEAALDAVRAGGGTSGVRLATFDLSPVVLEAVRDGRIQFAVDQQGYLQGYLPIVLLAQRIRYGLFAVEGDVVPTGPRFVTRRTAAGVVRLSERGIR